MVAKCKKHGNPLICLKCRASRGGKAKSAKKTMASRKNGMMGANKRWKSPTAAMKLAKKEGISRQLAYYRLKKEKG